jgi:hypothetical protein
MSNQFSTCYVRRLLFVAAAGMAVLGFIPSAGAADQNATATNQPSENQPNANPAVQSPALPDGFVQKDEDAASGVKSTLVQLTQRAVTKDSYNSFFSSFLSDLASRDKSRAQEFKGVDQKHLNDVIGQIQTAWQSKYGHAFDVSDTNLAFDEQYPIVQGEVSDPTAAAASNWPIAASAGQAINAGANTKQQQCNAKELTKGQAVAIIRFPAGDGLPDINVSLVHQVLTGWYADLPVDRTGEQIYNDLSSHLNYIATHQNQWPSDVNAGYRMVARNVAAALYGVSSQGGTASAQ